MGALFVGFCGSRGDGLRWREARTSFSSTFPLWLFYSPSVLFVLPENLRYFFIVSHLNSLLILCSKHDLLFGIEFFFFWGVCCSTWLAGF